MKVSSALFVAFLMLKKVREKPNVAKKMNTTDAKFDKIRSLFSGKRVLVAFSGGVDSTVLAHIAKQSAAESKLLTVDSITFPRTELQAAKDVAKELGIGLEVIQVDELSNKELVSNPVDRCYRVYWRKATQVARGGELPHPVYCQAAGIPPKPCRFMC